MRLAALLILGATVSPAQTNLTFALDRVFSGTGVPDTSPNPWLTANFQNSGTGTNGAGQVTLTMTVSSGLPTAEFVSEWDFNLNPILNPTNLQFTSVPGFAPAQVTALQHATDVKKADGDGLYDVNFDFQTSGGGGRFAPGEVFKYYISLTGSNTLTAGDFNFFSTPAGGAGPFLTAAHIQGIPNGDGSAWVTIPEPSACAAISGLAALAGVAFRRRALPLA